MTHLIDVIGDRDFSINIISKSELQQSLQLPSGIFKKLLIDKYGKKEAAKDHATTDKAKGALKHLADERGYETLLSPMTLVTIFCFNSINYCQLQSVVLILQLMEGAASMQYWMLHMKTTCFKVCCYPQYFIA